ncbi:hypothetical protein OAN307_c28840 [Octadecabacter antarcticus 307]|uniref:Uncharacterized protein n=1 Tax=Octadecabacter antarcticus 307 TaxID=391626 RepID=M9RDK3_9RHOB|nr:hypothetical protein OAN307_c28840 [Octadecabacter antarcticus 307]
MAVSVVPRDQFDLLASRRNRGRRAGVMPCANSANSVRIPRRAPCDNAANPLQRARAILRVDDRFGAQVLRHRWTVRSIDERTFCEARWDGAI